MILDYNKIPNYRNNGESNYGESKSKETHRESTQDL